MRTAIIAGALAAAVNAVPLVERGIFTVTEVTDVYTTVWDDAAESTPTTTAQAKGFNAAWHHQQSSAAASVVVVTATAAAYSAPAAAAAYTASAKSSAAAAPAYSGAATPSNYNDAVVAHHNAHRANHSAPALTWSDALAATAQKTANTCVYAHDVTTDGGGYGQNIAAGAPASNISSVITDLFYNNEVGNFAGLYGQATPSNINNEAAFDGWGHFSQLVWVGTTSVGCATADCSAKGLANTGSSVPPYFTVCNYKSAGNFLGEFASNVLPSLGQPSITWAET